MIVCRLPDKAQLEHRTRAEYSSIRAACSRELSGPRIGACGCLEITRKSRRPGYTECSIRCQGQPARVSKDMPVSASPRILPNQTENMAAIGRENNDPASPSFPGLISRRAYFRPQKPSADSSDTVFLYSLSTCRLTAASEWASLYIEGGNQRAVEFADGGAQGTTPAEVRTLRFREQQEVLGGVACRWLLMAKEHGVHLLQNRCALHCLYIVNQ